MKFDRVNYLRKWLPKADSKILELGPFFNPIFPKTSGFNTTTVDVYDRKKLVSIAETNLKLPVSAVQKIESVDFIWKGSLFETVGEEASFDVICSSHNFEHQPNPLLFLMEVEKLLAPGGVCTFAIPIASRCFDLFRNLSTTKDFLIAYRTRKNRPEWLDVYEANKTKVCTDGLNLHKHHKYDVSDLNFEKCSFLTNINQQQLINESPQDYIDIHMTVFNPARFKLIMFELSTLGILPHLKIFDISECGHEFLVHLSNDKTPIVDYSFKWSTIVKSDANYLRQELQYLFKKPNTFKSKLFFYR